MSDPTPSHDPRSVKRLAVGAVLGALLAAFVALLAMLVVPRALGYELLAIQGGSMGDVLPNGSLVVTTEIPAADVENGDIVVVSAGTGSPAIVHRVIAIDGVGASRVVTTQGDANDAPDPVPYRLQDPTQVPAVTVPLIGFVLMFVTTPLGWLLGIAIPASILTFLVIRDIWRDDERDAPADGGPDSREHWTARYGITITPQAA